MYSTYNYVFCAQLTRDLFAIAKFLCCMVLKLARWGRLILVPLISSLTDFFMNLFQTHNMDIIKSCQSYFSFQLPSDVLSNSAIFSVPEWSPDFYGTPLFNVEYLRNDTRYTHRADIGGVEPAPPPPFVMAVDFDFYVSSKCPYESCDNFFPNSPQPPYRPVAGISATVAPIGVTFVSQMGGSNLPRPHLVIFYFFPSA